MGGILKEGLLPLRLLLDIPAEAEPQQAHDGGDRQQYRKEHPVKRYDISGDGPDVYVHDIGVRLFPIVLLLLHGHEYQVMLVRFEGIALIECNIPPGAVFQQFFLQPVGIPIPCVVPVAILQLQKYDAGGKEVSLLPVLVIVRFVIGVGYGSILILCLADESLFCLTHKVCWYNEVHRQHEQGKEQQSRAEDQIHDPQLDVFHTLPAPFSL